MAYSSYDVDWIRYQIEEVEYWLNTRVSDTVYPENYNYYWKWKRHYLLKRLLAVQLKEFNRG